MVHRHMAAIVVTATVLFATVLSGTAPAAGTSSPSASDAVGTRGRVEGAFGERTMSLDAGRHGAIAIHLPGKKTKQHATPRAARYQGAGFSLRSTISGGWATTLIEIPDRDSPTSYEFTFDLPTGWALSLAHDGSASIVDEAGTRAGLVAPPWAVDSAGHEIATSFAVEGTSRLIQTVEHTDAVHPVVADPSVTLGRNVYLWLRGSEIGWWGSASAAFLSTYFCAVYGSLHPVLCAVGAAGAWWLITAFDDVFAGDRCRYVVAVRYWGWPNYMERLGRYGCTYRKSEIPG